MPIQITRSMMQDRNRCERKHHYKWIEELDPLFAAGSVSMRQGTLAHYGLQAGYEWMKRAQQAGDTAGKDAIESAFIDESLKAMAEMVASGISVYRGEEQPLGLSPTTHADEIRSVGDSVQFYARHKIWDDFNRYKILATEVPFDAMYFQYNGEDVVFSGVFDLLAQDVTHDKNVIIVMDHKTVSDVNSTMSFLPLDVQMLSYESLCAKELLGPVGYDDVEVIYNMIRREVPPGFGHRSALTPTGKKSTASQNPEDYLKRTSLWHSKSERGAIESNFLIPMLTQAAEAHYPQYHSTPLIPTVIRTGGEACSNCDFFARCKANIVGRGQPRFVHAS